MAGDKKENSCCTPPPHLIFWRRHCVGMHGDAQGRRHGFEGGGSISRAERAKQICLTPPLFPYLGGGQIQHYTHA